MHIAPPRPEALGLNVRMLRMLIIIIITKTRVSKEKLHIVSPRPEALGLGVSMLIMLLIIRRNINPGILKKNCT